MSGSAPSIRNSRTGRSGRHNRHVKPCPPDPAGTGDGLVIERVAEIASTNAELLDRPRLVCAPAAGPTAPAATLPGRSLQDRSDAPAVWLVAGHQTGGRGRRGRQWRADPQASLTASLGLELPRPSDVGPIPLVVGAAIAATLVGFGASPWLKWPNDLYVLDRDGRPSKAGGILCELRMAGDPDSGRLRLVIGCGLNLTAQPWHGDLSPPEIGPVDGREPAPPPVGHLFEALGAEARARLETALGHAILAAVREAVRDGAEAGLARWATFDLLVGRPIRVHAATGPYETVARGIDAGGRLLVDDPGARGSVVALIAEDVSVRWAASTTWPARPADTLSAWSDT